MGALFGFARLLWGLLKRDRPEFLAVCFDTPGPTFRHKAYAEYKATRKELDLDLKSQLALAREVADAMGLKTVEAAGWEADDLMATLARRAEATGLRAVLVTGDKDAMQLVGARVSVLNEAKGELYDPPKVRERYRVGPERIVDYLALVGDSSDNVKGVPGVGPVGAVKLLERFGDIDGILRAAKAGDPDLPPKTAQSILGAERTVLLGRSLITLDAQAPVDVEVADCRVAPADPARLRPVFERFEFSSLLKEMTGQSPAVPSRPAVPAPGEPASSKPAPEPSTPLELKAWLKKASGAKRTALVFCPLAGDGSGSGELPLGEDAWSLVLSLSDGAWTRAESGGLGAARAGLAKLLADPGVEKLGHDLKAALGPLDRAGLPIGGPLGDTLLAAYCADPGRSKYPFAEALARHAGLSLPAEDESRRAAERQATCLWALEEALCGRLDGLGVAKLYRELELPLVRVLAAMETRGIMLDRSYLRSVKRDFEARLVEIKREIDKTAGAEVNLNSTKQLRKLLFEDLGLPVQHKTPKGEPSTDEETLQALSGRHPLPALLMDYREVTKLQSTYVEPLLERMDDQGRVHTRFNQAGTATGRLSSLEPNLQNIPIRAPLGQKIRRAFVARPGWLLVSADYSQIDLRALAHLSGDPALCEAFANGEDVHLRTACEIFGAQPDTVDAEMRRRAKAVNFGIVYGQTAHGLSQELGIPFAAAKDYIQRYFVRYKCVAEWTAANLEEAERALGGAASTVSATAARPFRIAVGFLSATGAALAGHALRAFVPSLAARLAETAERLLESGVPRVVGGAVGAGVVLALLMVWLAGFKAKGAWLTVTVLGAVLAGASSALFLR